MRYIYIETVRSLIMNAIISSGLLLVFGFIFGYLNVFLRRCIRVPRKEVALVLSVLLAPLCVFGGLWLSIILMEMIGEFEDSEGWLLFAYFVAFGISVVCFGKTNSRR